MERLRLAGPPETIGASGTLSLVTLAEALAYLNKPSDSGGPFDVLIQMFIDSVSTGAFGIMGGRFLKQPADFFDFVFTPESDRVILLHQFPIVSISQIEHGHMTANGVWSSSGTIATTDYYADNRNGRIYGSWPDGILHSIRVRWQAGYATVPADAKEAALMWVGVKRSRQINGRWDVLAQQGPTEGYSFGAELPAASANIFAKYAIPEVSVA